MKLWTAASQCAHYSLRPRVWADARLLLLAATLAAGAQPAAAGPPKPAFGRLDFPRDIPPPPTIPIASASLVFLAKPQAFSKPRPLAAAELIASGEA